ncbi:Fic family protein [Atopobiaceae bacterium 24-176]
MARDESRAYKMVLEWWGLLPRPVMRQELDDFAMEFAYHSAKLEGAQLTYEEAREVFEQGSVTAYTGDVRSLVSVTNQKAAFAWMMERLAEEAPLDEAFMLTLHRTLTYGTYGRTQLADGERPGTYKLPDYLVRETHEVGAAPKECPRLTQELLRDVDETLCGLTPERAVTCAAFLHNELVSIHPFSEGTGRVAREMANYVLLRGGHPSVSVFEDEVDAYYRALEAFDDTGDLAPFKALLRHETVRSWEDRVR